MKAYKRQIPGYITQELYDEIEREANSQERSKNNFVTILIMKGWEVYKRELEKLPQKN